MRQSSELKKLTAIQGKRLTPTSLHRLFVNEVTALEIEIRPFNIFTIKIPTGRSTLDIYRIQSLQEHVDQCKRKRWVLAPNCRRLPDRCRSSIM